MAPCYRMAAAIPNFLKSKLITLNPMILSDSGFDYSNGLANVDPENGIHYGVINSSELSEDLGHSGAIEELKDGLASSMYHYRQDSVEFIVCGDGDVFVTKSKFYSLHRLPCAPGVGSLGSEGSVKAYCLGPEWYSNKDVPYRIFDVENGCEISETYLMVESYSWSGIKTMKIEGEELLDLELLIEKFLKLEYGEEVKLKSLDSASGLGPYDATIKTGWSDLHSAASFDSCSFWVKVL